VRALLCGGHRYHLETVVRSGKREGRILSRGAGFVGNCKKKWGGVVLQHQFSGKNLTISEYEGETTWCWGANEHAIK
jgi:hypothetical protein